MVTSDDKRAGAATIGAVSRLGVGGRRRRSPSDEREPTGLLREYLGFRARPALIFAALIIGALAVVTAIYVSIFGFDTWSTNMQRAGSMMVIRYCPQCQTVHPTVPSGGGGGGTKRQL